jgi:hypothetical protein
MSRKIFLATTLAVCLALAFAAISAANRTRSRSSRPDRGPAFRSTTAIEDVSQTFAPAFRRQIAPTGIEFDANGLQADSISQLVSGPDALVKKANAYLSVAHTQEPHDAYVTLQRVLDLGLDQIDTTKARRLQAAAYRNLADLYQEPSRQAYYLSKAVGFVDSPGIREELEANIQVLGGMPEIVAIEQMNTGPYALSPVDFGDDDTCDGGPPVSAPSITRMSIQDPSGGFEDRNFLQVVIPGPMGWALEIETTSEGCNDPISCSDAAFDTDMALWGRCEGGFEDNLVERDMNQGDGGLGWLSKIQTTCLLPGTYYLEVKGQFGAAPKNFDVNIISTDECIVPVEDDYEPDNTIPDSSSIGHPNSIPDHASGWLGRDNKDIQAHSIFPRNDDDHGKIDLTRTERVRMGTQVQFPSNANGFRGITAGPDEDTQLILFYGEDPHGGLCNTPPFTVGNYCKSSADCDPNAPPAVPSEPADTCFPLYLFTFGGEAIPRFFPDNPLAFNDDVAPSAGNLGSELFMCLPRTASGSPAMSVFDGFSMRSRGYRPPFPGSISDLAFDYESRSRNEGECTYEQEPNQAFADASAVGLNVFVSGIWEGSETFPFADIDLWGPFDVKPPFETVTLQVFPLLINPFGDSEVELWVGPDDGGGFYMVASELDDTGNEPNSFLTVEDLPPANENPLLGPNTMANAGYYVNVFGLDVVPNWYYNLRIVTPLVETDEVEPNDDHPQVVDYRGTTLVTAAIEPTCDIDRYQFTLGDDSFMEFFTSHPSTDTVLLVQQVNGGSLELTTELGITNGIGSGQAWWASFGPTADADNFAGPIEVADDGTGVTNGCAPLANDMTGKVAYIDRGACAFAGKVLNAQAAGATAVMIGNDRVQPETSVGGDCDDCTIPTVGITQAFGAAIKAGVPADVVWNRGAFEDVTTAAYGPAPTQGNFRGEIAITDDGTGATTACTPIVNDVAGKVAFIDRGACGFSTKTLNAQAAGATAALFGNDRPNNITPGGDCADCEIPTMMILQVDGTMLKETTPGALVVFNDTVLGCDDDGHTEGSNEFLSEVTGCVPAGDYIVSVRGWDSSGGPYVLNIIGTPGCTPTDPPTMSSTGEGSSNFCDPEQFERGCE